MAILARVPLAIGMLTGKMTRDTFAAMITALSTATDEAFDVGETFSGVDYETGLDAVDACARSFPQARPWRRSALRWILMFDAVTVIPGAKNLQQVTDNCAAAALPAFSAEQMAHVEQVYDELIREQVHHRW